jgi:UrcA family protein
MTTKTAFTALTAVLALGFAAAGHSASAQSADTVSVKVSYADLNLTTDAGSKVLAQRIRNAARNIGGSDSYVPIDQRRAQAECVDSITSRTMASLKASVQTAGNDASVSLASAR